MTFAKLFHKSNSSINQLYGNVLESTIESIRGSKVFIDAGMRASFVCLKDELKDNSGFVKTLSSKGLNFKERFAPPIATKYTMHRLQTSKQASHLFGEVFFKPIEKKNKPRFSQTSSNVIALNEKNSSKICFSNNNSIESFIQESTLTPVACGLNLTVPLESTERVTSFASHLCQLVNPKRGKVSPTFGRERDTNVINFTPCIIGIDEKRSNFSGDYNCHAPESVEKLSKRKLVWNELAKLFRISSKNRVKGFILNSVNGGYAVAIAGYIAFLPKSLCLNKKIFIGQWRQFSIISMNPKIANIVVKEIRTVLTKRETKDVNLSFSPERWTHWRQVQKNSKNLSQRIEKKSVSFGKDSRLLLNKRSDQKRTNFLVRRKGTKMN